MQRPLAGLTRRNFVREATAGVTLLAIAVPLNIGYAQIAGLPATAGLYALIVPTIVYALLASSRQVVASPDAAAAALVATSLTGLAAFGADYASMALAQAVICGVFFFIAAVFKLGFLANFLSKPILIGFLTGLALDIITSQVAKMLGISIDSGASFVGKVGQIVGSIGDANLWSIAISVVALAILLIGARLLRVVPWALVVLVLATVLVVSLDLSDAGVAVLGDVPSGPPQLTWPVLDWAVWIALIPSAAALTLVTMAQGLLLSRSYAEEHDQPVNLNRDLASYGFANVAAGASGGFAFSASPSRTAAMDQAGARTQLPSIVAAIGTLLLLVFGASLLEGIPSPAIGAVVAVAVLPLIHIRAFIGFWKISPFEFSIALTCAVVTLFVGSLAGIGVAFVLALINLAQRAASPRVDVLADTGDRSSALVEIAPAGSITAPGVLVLRPNSPIFFANAEDFSASVRRAVTDAGEVTTLIIDCEAVDDLDVTAAAALHELREWLGERDIAIALSRVRPQQHLRFQRLKAFEGITIHATSRQALEAARPRGNAPLERDR